MSRVILLKPGAGVTPHELLENAVRQNPAFDGWGILATGSDWMLLHCESTLLCEFIRKARPSWAELLPPLSASEGRISVDALAKVRLPLSRTKGTVRDWVADVIGDADFE